MPDLVDAVQDIAAGLDAEAERDPQFAMTWNAAKALFGLFALPFQIAASFDRSSTET